MHWHDYRTPQKKTFSPKWVGLFLALAFTVFLVGRINGWWQTDAPEQSKETTVTDVETAVMPTTSSTPLLVVESATAAPDFSLLDLFDETQSIRLSDYAGSPVILNFWASWCVPCREEMPALEQAYQEHSRDGLVLLGVNQTYIDDLSAAQAFVQELNVTFPSVRDDTGNISEGRYRVLGLPTTVFITPEGSIAHIQIGQLTESQIADFTQKLIDGKPFEE